MIKKGKKYKKLKGKSNGIKGKIKCKNEIKEAIWIDKDYKKNGIKVGSILGEHVIPNLVERGLM